MKNRTHFIIGSRGSRLALWQAEWVEGRLAEIHPDLKVRIEIIKTTGDQIQDVPLSVIGGKGVFTKELETALFDGRIDLAVHSLKDLPTILPEGLTIAAITEREDVRDALVLRQDSTLAATSLKSLPQGFVVGTSSQRRMTQLKHLNPQVEIKDLRGNVDTRLRKLDGGWYDAVILAAAGLRRLGFAERISHFIEMAEMLPAVGQGALGLETRTGDLEAINLLAPLNHAATHAACTAERALLRSLGGGCQLPIAGHAHIKGERLLLEGLVAAPDGKRIVRDKIEGEADSAEELGNTLGARLLEHGARLLLDSLPT